MESERSTRSRDEAGLCPTGGRTIRTGSPLIGTTLKRINRLIDDVLRDPFEGIGKPEPLRHAFAGSWSRRISEEHRLVYLVDGDDIVILQARYLEAETVHAASTPMT